MLKLVINTPVYVACLALFALMVMTFSDVALRSVANAPLSATAELTRILMAVVVFSVMPIVSATGQHISVDLTDGLFRKFRLARWRDAAIYLICGGLLFWPMQRVLVLADRARGYGDVTEYLNIPVFYVGWFIAASLAVTILAMLIRGLLIVLRPDLVGQPS